MIKVLLILFFYVWMRWTLPRYRYDQLMEFGWKWLLPAAVLNLIATAALVIWLGMRRVMELMNQSFYIFAGIAVLASLGVVAQRNPMHSVLLLIVSFGALAGLYVLLDAPFTAVTQIIIYAGAIMVLFLFVVMLLNAHTEDEVDAGGARAARDEARRAALGAAGGRAGLRRSSQLGSTSFSTDPAAAVGDQQRRGRSARVLFTTHSFAFEVTSILILVAMVGAVVIAGKPRSEH